MVEATNRICEASRVGRKMLWPEKMVAPLPEGTFARMTAVLAAKEDRTDLIREAVRRELERREAAAKSSR